jgi:crossover junction endodeoxyribonuclease RuvC
MIYIGIDPGKSGALAYIINDEDVNVIPFDEGNYRLVVRSIVEKYGANVRCCIERVNAMPKQGVTSMFNFGQNYGWILGMLDALEIPYETVTPKKWKAEFGLTGDKMDSVTVCKRMFPHVSLLPTERCKKDNDGMAEALLLAEYARRKM